MTVLMKVMKVSLLAMFLSIGMVMGNVAYAQGSMGPLEFGRDRPGSDFISTQTTNAEVCRQLCAQISECRAMTFNVVSNKCYLKNPAPSPVSNQQGVSAGKL